VLARHSMARNRQSAPLPAAGTRPSPGLARGHGSLPQHVILKGQL
jgi:hypothetical protein